MQSTSLKTFFSLLLVSPLAIAALGPGESFQINAQTGNYVVTYVDNDGQSKEGIYEPSTKINPQVTSTFVQLSNGQIKFSYGFTNTAGSQQLINSFSLHGVSNLVARRQLILNRQQFNRDDPELTDKLDACEEALVGPATWQKICVPGDAGLNLGWYPTDIGSGGGVVAGQSISGFGFSSPDLPGMLGAKFQGNGKEWITDDPTDFEITDDLDELIAQMLINDHVIRYVTAPQFAVPNPFTNLTAAPLASAIRVHIQNWPSKNLMAADLNAQATALLDKAITYLQAKDNPNAIAQLLQARTALRQKYPDLDVEAVGKKLAAQNVAAPTSAADSTRNSLSTPDQRLAAQVLDFNVSYIVGRLTGTPSIP